MSSQQNSSGQASAEGADTDRVKTTDDRSINTSWVDTISDWDAVLEASESVVSEDSDSPTVVSATRYDLPPEVDTLLQIEPISDELLDATMKTLPKEWLTDSEIQTAVQQFVYRFVEHTPKTEPTHDRFQAVCDELDSESLATLCTAPIYDDRPEMWTEYFEDDLEKLEEQIR